MTTNIVHLSDVHFGTEDASVLAGLRKDLERPTSLVVISGDLTQRATAPQFKAAKRFIDELRWPYLVVPGNHDVPLYNVFARFLAPLDRYQRYITNDLMPTFFNEHVAVVGVNTAHGFTDKGGKITPDVTAAACRKLAGSPAAWKILVAHHPFVIPDGVDAEAVVGAEEALPQLDAGGVEVVMTGHLHVAHASDEAAGFRSADRRLIAVHAGTAISRRTRGEANGYNTIALDNDTLSLSHRVWDGAKFVDGASKVYKRIVRHGEVQLAKVEAKPDPATPVP
ncbi:MAG: metallophosphoesterase [Kofleriaceae bacterium]